MSIEKINNKKCLSFVIPCYCSARTLPSVVDEIENIVSTRDGYDYQIVLVNDDSRDNTLEVIKSLCKNNPKIIGVNLARNFGQHAALMAGFAQVSGDVVISLDDDGQTPVDNVFRLIDKLDEGYDVVICQYIERKYNVIRSLGSFVNTKMSQILVGQPKEIGTTSSFFAVQKFVIKEMLRYENSFPYIAGLMFRTTKNVTVIRINHRERVNGKSNYTIKKMLKLWLNGFTAFSVKPLRISSIIGFICALIGFIFIIKIIVEKLINPNTLIGYSSIMAVILFVGGIMMIMLGLIGEYIGRIYISINKNPQYVIREIIKTEDYKKRKNDYAKK